MNARTGLPQCTKGGISWRIPKGIGVKEPAHSTSSAGPGSGSAKAYTHTEEAACMGFSTNNKFCSIPKDNWVWSLLTVNPCSLRKTEKSPCLPFLQPFLYEVAAPRRQQGLCEERAALPWPGWGRFGPVLAGSADRSSPSQLPWGDSGGRRGGIGRARNVPSAWTDSTRCYPELKH